MKKATLLCAVCVLAMASSATANDKNKHVRLNLDTSLFHFQKTTYDFSENGYTDKESVSTFGFGDGGIMLDDDFGASTAMFRLGVAGVVINRLSIGMTLGVGGGKVIWSEEDSEYQDDDDKMTVMAYEFLPYLAYKFDIGPVQPYLMITFGYGGSIFRWDDDADKMNTHNFIFGGGGGVHIFPSAGVSIDIGLTAKGNFGKLVFEWENDTVYASDEDTDDKEKYPLRGFKLNLVLGLSVWL